MSEDKKRYLRDLIISVVGGVIAAVILMALLAIEVHWTLLVCLNIALFILIFLYWRAWREAGKLLFYNAWSKAPINELKMLSMAAKSFSFITVSGNTSIYHPEPEEHPLERKLKADDLNVRILLFDYRSEWFENFIEQEGGDPADAKLKVMHVTETLLGMKERTNGNLEIRWYSRRPVWRFALVDDQHLFLGYHAKDMKGYQAPMIRASPSFLVMPKRSCIC